MKEIGPPFASGASTARPLVRLGLFLALASACQSANALGHVRAPALGDVRFAALERSRFDADLQTSCPRHGPPPDTLSGQLRRWPYLQKVSFDRAEILWTASASKPFSVQVWGPRDTGASTVRADIDGAIDVPGAAQYVAALEGLQPATTYCYQLVYGDMPITPRLGFRTAPAPGSGTARFVALGDLGRHSADQLAVRDQIEEIAFDFGVITGDVAYDDGTLAQFERNVFAVYRRLFAQIPFFPAAGNHDYRTDDARPFREVFSLFDNGSDHGRERWYSFDWGPVHVAVIDTQKLVDAQVQWLAADLQRTRAPWTVVVGHRSPFSSGWHGSHERTQKLLVPVLERFGVDLALFGHDHNYERTRPIGGVTYIITGGGGRGTRRVQPSSITAVASRVAHFVYVEADARALRAVAIDAEGTPFDSMRLESH